MKYLILALALTLSACATKEQLVKPEQVVVKETSYVMRIPPKELLEIPPPVPKIDIDAAKQSTIANWIIDMNARMKDLENKFIEIGVFFKLEKAKLDEQAAAENVKNKKAANEAQAAAALEAASSPKK